MLTDFRNWLLFTATVAVTLFLGVLAMANWP